jgi:hypothetical protein
VEIELDHAMQGESEFAYLACTLRAAAVGAPFPQGQRLFTEDFRGGLAQWISELEKPGKVEMW